jgi:hypothetical protein
MSEQTAVEWLSKELTKYYNLNSTNTKEEIIEKAKEMEKQQILDAFCEGAHDGYDGWYDGYGDENKEKYYNETYKKDEM